MAKQYVPEKVKFSAYEKELDDSIDFKKLRKPSKQQQEEIKTAARETLKELKSARANIRMSDGDLKALRVLADKAGIPYQTLIAHIIHLYVTDQLIHTREVKKMIEAGLFSKIG